jgi:predicted DsbA family dithiol-disulfide isomerase
MSQSTRAHRLSRKAYLVGGQEKQLPLLCALFRAFLEDGQDIADLDVLSDIAQQVGVFSKAEVRLFRTRWLSFVDKILLGSCILAVGRARS